MFAAFSHQVAQITKSAGNADRLVLMTLLNLVFILCSFA
jgi:hypothetical protein